MNNQKNQAPTERVLTSIKYERARSNLLLAVILTVINLVLLAFGSDSMMLFSATVPYILLATGIFSEITELLVICSADESVSSLSSGCIDKRSASAQEV